MSTVLKGRVMYRWGHFNGCIATIYVQGDTVIALYCGAFSCVCSQTNLCIQTIDGERFLGYNLHRAVRINCHCSAAGWKKYTHISADARSGIQPDIARTRTYQKTSGSYRRRRLSRHLVLTQQWLARAWEEYQSCQR